MLFCARTVLPPVSKRSPVVTSRRLSVVVLVSFAIAVFLSYQNRAVQTTGNVELSRESFQPRPIVQGHIVNWWGFVPKEIRTQTLNPAEHSNLTRADYAGAESCRNCHARNYDDWSKHPHRWMNAIADESTVKGDFSGEESIAYRGGTARFYREDVSYRMQLERGDVSRVYQISQTIGSRFYQYYVGTMLSGPDPVESPRYSVDHVLPFGYWLEKREWVPTVHVHWAKRNGETVDEEDVPSDQRPDPFALSGESLPFTEYFRCNKCHTTFPLGDLLVRDADTLGRHLQTPAHFDSQAYLQDAHPQLIEPEGRDVFWPNEFVKNIRTEIWKFDARTHAVNLGISCEACHLGSREHADGKLKKPHFFARGEHLYLEAPSDMDFGRTHHNLNWICARCHTGNRRQLAAGMATWNSTEFTDAMRGSCYSQLKCVDCHNPHQATGTKWTNTPDLDDQLCLNCHQKFEPNENRLAHTHHPVGSRGARCMNCHMPRVNEGLQDVVRTHMIYSPNDRRMIESNQPNACNLCHTKEPIGWTLNYLNEWYGAKYDAAAISSGYRDLKESVTLGWLKSPDQSVRLIAADALARTNSEWALSKLIDALDDPFLLNRQFAGHALESMKGIQLESYGYRHYMERHERIKPLEKIRNALLPVKSAQRRLQLGPLEDWKEAEPSSESSAGRTAER